MSKITKLVDKFNPIALLKFLILSLAYWFEERAKGIEKEIRELKKKKNKKNSNRKTLIY